ncbi:MAG: type I-F CRISPR-associated endonuclease Cas1 [Verrucomicrobia bacterium]|nr:type I-F CRISPR-associated endonuclease Cas1 [Verrucomicrobiota bacterium]
MKQITSSDLKTILHSKRANIYYLEHCRVLVNGGRVEYVTEEKNQSFYWNIPIANTTTILLGSGTSITQAAVRDLCRAGVMIGFCGGGGTPLYAGSDGEVDIQWFSPQSEYRPTEYLQNWFGIWVDSEKRLEAAKKLQIFRANFVQSTWGKNYSVNQDFRLDISNLNRIIRLFVEEVQRSETLEKIFSAEAHFTKNLYKIASESSGNDLFVREKKGLGVDPANKNLDYGNYLAYGLGATATWVLGIPHGLSLLHGKTRRGGLVFDVADLVKDAIVLPQAFISAQQGHSDQEFRALCIKNFACEDALDFMIDSIKSIAQKPMIQE